MNAFTIRDAVPADADPAAQLLAETMAGFGVAALGLGDRALELRALRGWFAVRGNRFSHQFAQVALVGDEVAGILLSFPGRLLTVLELGCLSRFIHIYGIINGVRMLWRNKVLGHTREATSTEYLLAHLAVDERFRRQGIAASLLDLAVEKTRQAGLERLVLEVEIGNLPAITLYEKCAFRIEGTQRFGRNAAL